MAPHYVLITPARNEAQFIELTIKSVVAQTTRPLRWVIVSDGSTDATDDIVKRYIADHSWIELVRTAERPARDFAGKVWAFNAGYARVSDLQYDVIGNLDGDASFDSDYFSFLLHKLASDSRLGLVGTVYTEASNRIYDYRFTSIEYVTGICQLFRRQCFEEIGGYVPVKGGAIDTIAVIAARMKGWETRTFTEKACVHHRGAVDKGVLKEKFRSGTKDYAVGNHPVWELARVAYQMTRKPIVVAGLMLAAGYFWALLRRQKRAVSMELAAFHRRDQMRRLKSFLLGLLSRAA